MEKLEQLAFSNIMEIIDYDPKKEIIVEDLKQLTPLIQQNIHLLQMKKEIIDKEGNKTVTRFFKIKLKDSTSHKISEHYGIGKFEPAENPENEKRPRVFVVPAFRGHVELPEEAKILAENSKNDLLD